MRHSDLNELISKSSSARKYFLSLPVDVQMSLHQQNDFIRSSSELHLRADLTQKTLKYNELSDSIKLNFKDS